MTLNIKLSEISEIIMGQSPKGDTCNKIKQGMPLLNGPSEFGVKYPLPIQYTTDPKKESKIGDILFCVRGSTGKMNYSDVTYAIGRGLAAIRGKNGYPTILIRAILEVKMQELLSQASGTVFTNLNKEQLYNFPIPKLDDVKIKRISNILKNIEDKIYLCQVMNETLEGIAQALFKSWFIDFDPVHAKQKGMQPEGIDKVTAALFPDSFEQSESGEIPRGWRVGTLGDLASFQNGYAFKGEDWAKSGHPVIKIGNVKPGLISFKDCSFVGQQNVNGLDRFKLHRGDLLVGMTGYVGETGLVSEVSPAAYLNQRVGRLSSGNGVQDIGFIYCLTRNETFKIFAETHAHGSAQANVSGTDLLKLPSVIPDSKVLASFNAIVHPLIESIISNYETQQTLSKLRNTLLPRLISGQLRLPNTEDQIEVAA